MLTDAKALRRKKAYLHEILEEIGSRLDLSATQYASAESAYGAVAAWMTDSLNGHLKQAQVFPQGSIRIQTAIHHPHCDEVDVDLICAMPSISSATPPAVVKKLVGDRLKEHGTYREKLTEKNRCWRLDYAGGFHLDITPAIGNPECKNGGLLVPDKELKQWKPTHPIAYADRFDQRANLQPALRLLETSLKAEDAQPMPKPMLRKGLLRRGVQLAKWNRDVYFNSLGFQAKGVAPISIIITTLLARSYEATIRMGAYDHELDVLLETVRLMPKFIEQRPTGIGFDYWIENETTVGENFAEKWNTHRERPAAFFEWHHQFVGILEKAIDQEGEDALAALLETGFGREKVTATFDHLNSRVEAHRAQGRLVTDPSPISRIAGVASVAGAGVQVRRNTFFGA